MIPSIGTETLDDAFRRVRDLDVSLQEQLRNFAETVKQERPEFAAAVDRLIQRLREYGAGESAPQIGESMPPFVLPDDAGQMVRLRERAYPLSMSVRIGNGTLDWALSSATNFCRSGMIATICPPLAGNSLCASTSALMLMRQ